LIEKSDWLAFAEMTNVSEKLTYYTSVWGKLFECHRTKTNNALDHSKIESNLYSVEILLKNGIRLVLPP